MMKLFVLLVALLSVCDYAYSSNIAPFLLPIREKCKADNAVPDDVYSRANKLDIDYDNRNLQCYTKCVFSAIKAIDDEGNIDGQVLYGSLLPERQPISGPPTLECASKNGEKDGCKRTIEFYRCMLSKLGDDATFL